MKRMRKAHALGAVSIFLLSACGGDAGGGAGSSAEGSEPIRVDLAAVNQSAAEGSVSLTLSEGSYSAVVSIDTHRGPGEYPVEIHAGSCAAMGPLAVELSAVEGQEGGEGQSRTTFSASELPAGGSYYIELRDAQDDSVLGCGDLPDL